MKKFFYVFLLLNCFILTGCFQGETSLEFDSSGKITFHNKFIGVPYAANQIEEIKNNIVKSNPNAKVKNITEGNLSGYDILVEYKNLEEFNSQGFNLYTAKKGKSSGITKNGGWFYDSYNVDLFIEGQKSSPTSNNEYSQLGESMAQAILSQAKLDLKIVIPNSSVSNNADVVSDDGKILSWNIINSFINGQNKQIKLNFKVLNTGNVMITILSLIVIIGLIVKFKKKNKPEDNIEQ